MTWVKRRNEEFESELASTYFSRYFSYEFNCRCPQCGTVNGTRGLSCKNSLCDMVFKEILEKPRKVNLDACKLITEQGGGSSSCLSWTTIFSIRVKDRCPDYLRGFVQIEFEDLNNQHRGGDDDDCQGSPSEPPNPILLQLGSVDVLTPTKGTCYVLGCWKRCQTIKLVSGEDLCCIHVLSCVSREDYTESQPLTLKHSVLNSMNISAESKQKIFMKAREGPLVQRVNSSGAMVVRCDKDNLHPLGYLHTYFFKKASSTTAAAEKFGCSCHLSLPPLPSVSVVKKKSNASIVTLNSPEMHLSNTPVVKDRCLHFYSCLAAFSGDATLSKEYSRFISDDYVVSSMQQVIAILDSEDNDGSIKVIETAAVDNLDLYKEELYGSNDFRIEMDTDSDVSVSGCSQTITLPAIAPDEILKRPMLDEVKVQAADAGGAGNPDKIFEMEAITVEGNTDLAMSHTQQACHMPPAFTAIEWLASITESINAAMHYGFAMAEPLVFHVPQTFFNFLMDRISGASSLKKRLPNSTESFQRTVPPISRYTRYTWHLTNIFHLKKVFDTPSVGLEISRRFAKHPTNGSYSLLKSQETSFNESTSPSDYKPSEVMQNTKHSRKIIKPVEYKTFLKVGQMSTDPRDVTPFTIEWVPDLYPRTHLGELKIKFEFGHQLNGQLDLNTHSHHHGAA